MTDNTTTTDARGPAPQVARWHDYPKYETWYLHPNPERDPNEVERWLNQLPGRLMSVLNSPWDPTGLMAVTMRWV